MAVSISLTDRGQAAPTSTTKSTLAWLGVCSGGSLSSPGPCYEFTSAGLVGQNIGYGPLTEGVAAGVRVSQVKQIACKVAGTIAGTKSVVAQTGTGPAITLSGTPYDTTSPKLKVTKGGDLGTSTFRLALDGGTYGPTVDVPYAGTAQVTGTIDISALSWPQTGLTLILDGDVGVAITYTALIGETTLAAFIANANAAFVAGPSSARIRLVQGRYIQAYSITAGSASSIAVSATSTLDTVFGLSNVAATGAAATYAIPNTGLVATFPAGTYVVDEIYSWTTVEPSFSTTELVTALIALQQSGLQFRDIVILASPVDGTDTRAFAAQLGTSLASWRAGPPKKFAVAIVNSSVGLSSAIATNDTDVKVSMSGQSDDYVAVTHGDIFMAGTEMNGSFRRPLSFAIGVRAAAYPISSDPGNREQPQLEESSMVGPDGVTLARDEETATVKMAEQKFTVAKNEFGAAYAVRGITRSVSPKFAYLAILRMGVQLVRVFYDAGRRYENARRKLTPNGTIREADAKSIEKYIRDQILLNLGDDISGNPIVTVDRAEVTGTTNNLNISADVQHLGYFFTVNLIAGVVDIIVR
jgi:hypothetical protein